VNNYKALGHPPTVAFGGAVVVTPIRPDGQDSEAKKQRQSTVPVNSASQQATGLISRLVNGVD
jgi:hypothetical protein